MLGVYTITILTIKQQILFKKKGKIKKLKHREYTADVCRYQEVWQLVTEIHYNISDKDQINNIL